MKRFYAAGFAVALLASVSGAQGNPFIANGANPTGGLIANASGVLYGTTSSGGVFGGGTVFSLADDGTLTIERVTGSNNPRCLPEPAKERVGNLQW